ncbi:hypothetical protein Pyrde_0792 [Pyrodictium delaneyi]|uniref:Uncharacterized protein n=1 Tax=Pyrodictium delaneyi TaxID=1273541 RepID=A0A0P0N2K7_9CREN|nr:hypothetical protein [Pyrodictium delaneyi]ALL00842.1 hypothetical protein Pyrde_0792 [Pyrodictium delaneyi]OWJ55528.1 hypothetical protein Pdsh_01690 [Pyrodictium delaneyi]
MVHRSEALVSPWRKIELDIEQPVILSDGLYNVCLLVSSNGSGEQNLQLAYLAVEPIPGKRLVDEPRHYVRALLLAHDEELDNLRQILEKLPYRFRDLIEKLRRSDLALLDTTNRLLVRYGFLSSPPGPKIVYVPEPHRVLVFMRDLEPFLERIAALPNNDWANIIARALARCRELHPTGITYVFDEGDGIKFRC